MTIGQGTSMQLGAVGRGTSGIGWVPSAHSSGRASARSVVGVLVGALLLSMLGALPQVTGRLTPSDPASTAISDQDKAAVEAQIEAAQLYFRPTGHGAYVVENAGAGIAAELGRQGLAVRGAHGRGHVVLRTEGFGRPGAVSAVPAARPNATDSTATVQRGGLVEWFSNRDGGLEQGWTVPTRPAGEGALLLDLGVTGGSVEVAGRRSARFVLPGGAALSYDGLTAHDARGVELDAGFVETPSGLRIRVDDAVATYPIVIDPVLSAVATMDPTPNAAMDHFGSDVAIDGRWMVVGAYTDAMVETLPSPFNGSVNVYFDDTGNGDWRLLNKLTGYPTWNQMGWSVAVDVEPGGVTIAAGSPSLNRAAVWTYLGDPLTVAPNAAPSAPTFFAPQAYAGVNVGQYGYSVDLEDGVLAIGAPFATRSGLCTPDGPDADTNPDSFNERIGIVEVWRRAGAVGTAYTFENRLEPANGLFNADPTQRDVFQEFGRDVSIAGNLIAVGARGDDGVLTPTSGTCGAPAAAGTNTNDGAAYVFRYQGGSTWTRQTKITPSTRRTDGEFGVRVALSPDGDLLAGEPSNAAPVSASGGQAYLFEHTFDSGNGTDSYTQSAAFNNDDPNTPENEADDALGDFGSSVGFDETGKQFIIGAWRHNSTALGTWSGATFVYERAGTAASDTPALKTKIAASYAAEALGYSGAITTGRVVSGAINADLDGYDTGRAEVWARGAGGTWAFQKSIEPVGDTFPVDFGFRFARDGDLLAVSTIREGRGLNRLLGTIYLFRLVGGQWKLDDYFWADAGNILSTAARYDGGLDIWVNRVNGVEQGVYVAVGSTQDTQIDRDGRGDNFQPQDVGAVGTVTVFGKIRVSGTLRHSGFSTELWAGGHQENVAAGRAGLFNPATLTVGGKFGSAVAFTSDGTLLVGEPGAAGGAGQVHRYERDGKNEGFAPGWVFAGTTAGDPALESALGSNIATEGSTVVTAAKAANGFIRVHHFDDGSATGALTSKGDYQVGLPAAPIFSVDTDGTRLAVGAVGNDTARVYKLPTATTPLLLEGEFKAPANGNYGISVALGRGGSTPSLVVGNPFVTPTSGQAEVYVAKVSTGGKITTWSDVATLAPPAGDPGNGAFGFNVMNYPAADGALVSSHTFAVPSDGRGRVYRFSTAALVPPPGPQAMVDVSTPSTVPVGASYIPTAGLAPSLLTNNTQGSGSLAAAPLGDVDLSQPPAGTTVQSSPMGSIPMGSIFLGDEPGLDKIMLSQVPLSTPGGWEAVLAGTALGGAPLQSVSLADVFALNPVPNAVKNATLSSIGLSDSPMGSIPMGSIALGALPVADLALDPSSADSAVKQWCDALAAADFDPARAGLDCSNPSNPANQDVTVVSVALAGAPMGSIPMGSIPMGSIPMGSIPMGSIPMGSIDIDGSPMGSIPMGSIDLTNIPMGSIPMGSIPMGSIPMGSIPMGSIQLGGVPMGSIPMGSIDINGSPMGSIPMGSIDLTGVPMGSIPMGSIPMGSIPMGSIPMGSIQLGGVPMGSIPMGSIPMGSIPMGSIPMGSIDLTDVPMGSIPMGSIPMGSIPMGSIPMGSIFVKGSPMGSIPMGSIDIQGSPMGSIPMGSIAPDKLAVLVKGDVNSALASAKTLGELSRLGLLNPDARLDTLLGALQGIRLGDLANRVQGYTVADFLAGLSGHNLSELSGFDDTTLAEFEVLHQYLTLGDVKPGGWAGVRLGDIAALIDGFTSQDVQAALNGFTLADFGGRFDNLTLGDLTVLLQYLTLSDLAGGFDSIRLGDLVGRISNGVGGTYTEAQLRQALTQAMGSDAVFRDLGPDFGDLTLGDLANYNGMTLGQLFGALDSSVANGITFGDLLAALISRTQYPWEALDLDNALTQTLDGSDQSVPVSVAFSAQAPDGAARDVTVSVKVPDGSVYLPGSAAMSVPVGAGQLEPAVVDGALVWTFTGLPANAVHTLSFRLEPTVRIGSAAVSATVSLPSDDEWSTDQSGLTVLEVLEPNDTPAQASALPADTIALSHVSSTDDIDVFSFPVNRVGTRVSISLSNLDADLDLVLYAPKASSATIQDTSKRSISPVEDQTAASTTSEVAPVADNDVATPAGLGELAVYQNSLHRGSADEQIDTGPLATTGTYYVAVSGYNGATNRTPYALRLKKFESTALPACTPRSVNAGTVSGSLPQTLSAGTNTVFLVNQSRMAGLFTQAQAASVRTGVDNLVTWLNDSTHASLGVKAAVLPVDADAGVRTAYANWDAEPCKPDTANAVVKEIVRVLDKYRDAGVKLKHIVVVGGDDAIPFARVPDKTEIANERGYASTFSDARNALSATFQAGNVLTDDAYGDLDPYGFGDRVLFVTDAAVGRLVETPVEITDQLTDFTAASGRLNVGTGLVTGYDFLTDGARAVADKVDNAYGTIDRSLISDTWTRSDLENAIHTIKPDVASINAHFDHFRALPGLGNSTNDESDLFTAAAVRGALNDDFAAAIVFSMGCHGGLSASDLLAGAGRKLDFAQAVSSQGGVFVGNTGYGYGDTDSVALSERLMAAFAERLDGSLSVGEALRYAKAEYAADLTAYGVYDEKALMEATFYGLPFYRLNVTNPPAVAPLPPAPTLSPDPIAGVDTSTIQVTPTHQERTASDGDTYYVTVAPDGDDQTTALHDRPVEPRTESSFSAPTGKEPHDALVTNLSTTDLHGVMPHILEPVVDDSDERVDEPVDVAFPSSPVRVNPELVPSGQAYTMSATTGYFRTTALDGSGIQRLVNSMTVTPYFVGSNVDDFVRPTIKLVDAVVSGSNLTFSVDVVDDRGAFDRIKRVYVLAMADPQHGVAKQWQGVNLVRTPGDSRWTGSLTLSGDEVEYVVQAVDAAGNVGVAANRSLFFRDEALSDPTTPPGQGLRLQLSGNQGNAGWYVGPVTVTAKGGSNLTYEIVGEVSERPYQAPFTIGTDGPHTVIVRSSDGQEVARTIKIDTHGPTVVITNPADGSTIAHKGGAKAQFACLDAGSGVTSCGATLTTRNGFGNSAGTTAPVNNGDDVSGTIGRHTIVAMTGADVAGNPATIATATSNFNVVPAPRINAVNLPNNPGGNANSKSVATSYSGVPQAAPYTTTYTWDDGSTTTCRSDQVVSGCSIMMGADGLGSTLSTHTYPSLVERDVFVTITDAIGQTATGTISFNKTTVLTVTPALFTLNLLGISISAGAVSATLTDKAGVPLPGRVVTFKASNGLAMCTATTNSVGKASCGAMSLPLTVLALGTYTASVPGDSTFLGVTTSASLIKIL